MNRFSTLLTASTFALLVTAACSSSSSGDGASGGSSGAPSNPPSNDTCTAACSNVQKVCAAEYTSTCQGDCQKGDANVASCVTKAASCGDLQTCSNNGSSGTPSSSGSSGTPSSSGSSGTPSSSGSSGTPMGTECKQSTDCTAIHCTCPPLANVSVQDCTNGTCVKACKDESGCS